MKREEFEIEGSSSFNHMTFILTNDKPEKIGNLTVTFNTGAVYIYFKVKRSWIDEIMRAESKGKELRKLIINNKDIKYDRIKDKEEK